MEDLNAEFTPEDLELLLKFANENIEAGKIEKKQIQEKWLIENFNSSKFNLSSNIDFWKDNGVFSINLRYCETDTYSEFGFGYSIKTDHLIIILALGTSHMINFIENQNESILNYIEEAQYNNFILKIRELHDVFEELKSLHDNNQSGKDESVVYFILNDKLDWNPSFDNNYY